MTTLTALTSATSENLVTIKKLDFWDSMLLSMRDQIKITELVIAPSKAKKYTYDFFGLLKSLSTPESFLFIITRINGYACSQDFDGKTTKLLMPDHASLSRVNAIFTNAVQVN